MRHWLTNSGRHEGPRLVLHAQAAGNCYCLTDFAALGMELAAENLHRKDKQVKFTIEIGESEKNRLEYNFNQLTGNLLVKINERPVKKSRRLINEPVLEILVFEVGEAEKSTVRIEKERKQLLGSRNRLYVNNRLVKVFEGL